MTVSYQADDPRQNLRSSDWNVWNVHAVGSNPISGVSTIGSCNANKLDVSGGMNADTQTVSGQKKVNPSDLDESTYDKEITSYVEWHGDKKDEHISTAFIRHAPMQSPWELGMIHRGSKWRTLNLSKATNVSAEGNGGAAYEDGDGQILDQVKMVPEFDEAEKRYLVPQKVNLSTECHSGLSESAAKKTVGFFALKALFAQPDNEEKRIHLLQFPELLSKDAEMKSYDDSL